MPDIFTVTTGVVGAVGATITILQTLRKRAPTRERRSFGVATPLWRQEDLRASLGENAETVLPYQDRLGYVPVDLVSSRKKDRAVVVPGASLKNELSPLQRHLGGSWVPTRPVVLPKRVTRRLAKNPGKVLEDVRPIDEKEAPSAGKPGDRTQVIFMHKGRPHIGTQPSATLSDLFELDELVVPATPIVLFPPETADRKLVEFKGFVITRFGRRRPCRLRLTTRALRIIERPRYGTFEVLRDQIVSLRLDTSNDRLEIGLFFSEVLVEARRDHLQQIHEMLLGM